MRKIREKLVIQQIHKKLREIRSMALTLINSYKKPKMSQTIMCSKIKRSTLMQIRIFSQVIETNIKVKIKSKLVKYPRSL